MLGKKVEKLEAAAARLEAVAARLDRHDGIGTEASASPAVLDEMSRAANETLHRIFGDVHAAIMAGERDRSALIRLATPPMISALASVPPRQAVSATRAALTMTWSLLIDRLLELEQVREVR